MGGLIRSASFWGVKGDHLNTFSLLQACEARSHQEEDEHALLQNPLWRQTAQIVGICRDLCRDGDIKVQV